MMRHLERVLLASIALWSIVCALTLTWAQLPTALPCVPPRPIGWDSLWTNGVDEHQCTRYVYERVALFNTIPPIDPPADYEPFQRYGYLYYYDGTSWDHGLVCNSGRGGTCHSDNNADYLAH